jgi:hypothetical protein
MLFARSILAAGLGLLLMAGHAGSAVAAASAAEVKAAATANFLLFVRWPSPNAPNSKLRLCVLAEAPLVPELQRFDGLPVQGTTLSLQPIDRSLAEVRLCDAIYVDRENPHDLPRVVAATRGQPILIIAEGEHALQQGAMIALSVIGTRIVFDINLAAARSAGLNLSAKLLRLARSVAE